jgi:hypothetical protein
VTRVIFVVFSEKDEKMYRKGITVQFPPLERSELEPADFGEKDVKEKVEGDESGKEEV